MANIQITKLKADVLDRMDNTVLSGSMTEAMRTKLSATPRINNAIREALLGFATSSEAKALFQLQKLVTLSPVVAESGAGVNAYLWPEQAMQERTDLGLLAMVTDGTWRNPRESTPLESVRMQASNGFYGTLQPAFTLDPAQKRIFAPELVVLKAQIIRTPVAIESYSFAVVLTGTTDSGSSTFSISDGTTTITLDTGAFESAADLATRLYAAINASQAFLATASAFDTSEFLLTPKILNEQTTFTISTTDTLIEFTPATTVVSAGYYGTELPIHESYHDTLVLMTLGSLLKSSAASAIATPLFGIAIPPQQEAKS